MGAIILVGCGGTGIRTLIRVNELLSEDTYWRPRLNTDFYYILVDTDIKDVGDFQKELRQQIGSTARATVVETVGLAQGFDNLEQPVNEIFVTPFGKDGKAGKTAARQRLMQHWWHLSNGEPFKAAHIKPLAEGAGQCPAISYLLTWKYLKRIEEVFQRVIDAVKARKEIPDPLNRATFLIVGSLAGGTGRGSWKLLAFKLREMFGRLNKSPRPLAFLSDVTIFDDVMKREPKQELAMRVNSITGMSELSAWMRNVRSWEGRGPPRIEYRLPATNKADDLEADVLKLPANDDTAYAPADAVFLTFRSSGRGFLQDSADAHAMVGTAIYAGLTRQAIRSKVINDARKQYWGIAAATFEVPAMTLGRYFENHACMQTLREMTQPDQDLARDRADAFISAHPWIIPTGINHIQPDKDGDLIDRVWFHLTDELRQDWEDLATILHEQQDEEAALAAADEKVAERPRAVAAALKAVSSLDPVALVTEAARKMYLEMQQVSDEASGQRSDRRAASLATVGEFVGQIVDRVTAKLAVLRKESYVVPQGQSLQQVIRDNAGLSKWIVGTRFEAAEIGLIEQAYRKSVFARNFKLVRQKVEEKVKSWLSDLGALAAAARTFCGVCDRVASGYQEELNKEFKTNGFDPFEQLFTDPQEPEHSVSDRFDPDRFYRRSVKPVLDREGMRQMLREGLRDVDLRGIDQLVIRNVFEMPLPAGHSNRANDLVLDMRQAVDESVALDREFVRKNFSLEAQVGKLRDVWQNRLQRALGRQDKFDELAKRFTAFFGVEPQVLQKTVTLGTRPVDFLARMAASLAARCRPYWQIDEGVDSIHSVMVFMPAWGGQDLREKKQEIETSIKERLSDDRTRVEVEVEQGETANPFVMLAYSSATADEIEHVRSLDYWQDAPDVKRLLELCEEPDGRSLSDMRTNGVAFTDPMYVRNDDLAKLRWRPWYTGEREKQEREALAIDALVYATLEPNEDLTGPLDKLGWSLPLLKLDKGKISFARVDLLWENERRRDNPQSPWRPGETLDKSLSKAHELLDGQTNGQRHPNAARGEAIRDALLAEAERFWTGVALKLGFGPGSDKRRQLLEHQQKLLSERRRSAKGANKGILERMIGRLAERLA